jgi:Glu-tRNA(Gln) amidotransferase subunit E-like FAD-binding protein
MEYIKFLKGDAGVKEFMRKVKGPQVAGQPRNTAKSVLDDFMLNEFNILTSKINTDKEASKILQVFRKTNKTQPDILPVDEVEAEVVAEAPLPAPVPGEQVEAAIEAPLPAVEEAQVVEEAPAAGAPLSEEEISNIRTFVANNTKDQLKEACRENGLPISGGKFDLAYRLVKAGFIPEE